MTKTLNTAFSAAVKTKNTEEAFFEAPVLPEHAEASIAAYLERHSKVEEADSQRLHDGLLSIHQNHISSEPIKLGAFLHALRLLRPAIKGQARNTQWWDLVILPVLDGAGHRKAEVDNASGFILAVLEQASGEEATDEPDEVATHFASALLQAYLKRTRTPDVENESLTAEDEFVARQLENVLVAYGCKRPKAFLLTIDQLLVKRTSRLQILVLLCAFVRQQPPHLYTVSQTPVIEHMIKCLMIDTSTTAVSLALTTLIMFLPHIPSSVRTHLPRLFLIYSRILCWERHSPVATTKLSQVANLDDAGDEENEKQENEDDWEKLETSFDNAESTAPELIHFFTFLYGLYPLNFTSYVHKPRKYLKKINFPRADQFDLDQTAIRKRTEQFRRVHLLHPNFFNTNLEDELEDDRWLKTDPPDVVSECMGLSIVNPDLFYESTESPSARAQEISGSDVHTNDIPMQTLPSNNDAPIPHFDPVTTPQRFQSAPGTPSTMGSPLTKPHDAGEDVSSIPHFSHIPQRLLASPHASSNASQSPRLGPVTRAQMPRSPALRPAPVAEANMVFLQRELMLLKSDLEFERYLNQQRLSHIGQLQRRNIKEATVEAEALNLLNTNRVLKAQLAKANESYNSLKRETQTGRNQAKKWEAELSTKFRALKEDEKKWIASEESLTLNLQKATKECDQLRQLVVDSEARELLARQELQFTEVKLEQLDTLKERVKELEDKMQAYRLRETEFERSRDEKESLKREIEVKNLAIQGRDASAERVGKEFQRRLAELELQLHAARHPVAGSIPTPGQFSPQVHILIESALTVVNAKYAALKKEHNALRNQHVELDSKCLELQDALDAYERKAGGESEATGAVVDEDDTARIPASAPSRTMHMPIGSHKSNASSSSSHSQPQSVLSSSAPTESRMDSLRAMAARRTAPTSAPPPSSWTPHASSVPPPSGVNASGVSGRTDILGSTAMERSRSGGAAGESRRSADSTRSAGTASRGGSHASKADPKRKKGFGMLLR